MTQSNKRAFELLEKLEKSVTEKQTPEQKSFREKCHKDVVTFLEKNVKPKIPAKSFRLISKQII